MEHPDPNSQSVAQWRGGCLDGSRDSKGRGPGCRPRSRVPMRTADAEDGPSFCRQKHQADSPGLGGGSRVAIGKPGCRAIASRPKLGVSMKRRPGIINASGHLRQRPKPNAQHDGASAFHRTGPAHGGLGKVILNQSLARDPEPAFSDLRSSTSQIIIDDYVSLDLSSDETDPDREWKLGRPACWPSPCPRLAHR